MDEMEKIAQEVRRFGRQLQDMKRQKQQTEARIASKIQDLVRQASTMEDSVELVDRLAELERLASSEDMTHMTLEEVEKKVDEIYGDQSKNETYYFSRNASQEESNWYTEDADWNRFVASLDLEDAREEADETYGDQSKNETYYFSRNASSSSLSDELEESLMGFIRGLAHNPNKAALKLSGDLDWIASQRVSKQLELPMGSLDLLLSKLAGHLKLQARRTSMDDNKASEVIDVLNDAIRSLRTRDQARVRSAANYDLVKRRALRYIKETVEEARSLQFEGKYHEAALHFARGLEQVAGRATVQRLHVDGKPVADELRGLGVALLRTRNRLKSEGGEYELNARTDAIINRVMDIYNSAISRGRVASLKDMEALTTYSPEEREATWNGKMFEGFDSVRNARRRLTAFEDDGDYIDPPDMLDVLIPQNGYWDQVNKPLDPKYPHGKSDWRDTERGTGPAQQMHPAMRPLKH